MALTRWQRPDLAWSGLEELEQLRREMDQLMELPFVQASSPRFFRTWAPPVDLYEDANNLYAKVEVPGMRKEDIDVSLHNGSLTISGERKRTEQTGETHRTERFSGRFSRSLTLPVLVDANKVSASYRDGVLMITLPKAEEAKPKQIEINIK